MKTKRIFSLMGATLLALGPTVLAAGHGGGGGDLVAAVLPAAVTLVAAVDSVAVALAAERSIPAPEGSAVVVPRTFIVEGWVSHRPVLDRCGLRFSNPVLPQGRPGLVAG